MSVLSAQMSEVVNEGNNERITEIVEEIVNERNRASESAALPEEVETSLPEDTGLPCDDATRPVCKQHVLHGNCRKRHGCRFFHPLAITPAITKKARREPGFCYCGSAQRRLLNNSKFRPGDDADKPLFFAVCGRTGRSMKRCM